MAPRLLLPLLSLGTVLLLTPAHATPAGARAAKAAGASPTARAPRDCSQAVRFTSDALLPLAIVRNGKLEDDRGQCPEEVFPEGQRWAAINRFGRVVGTVAGTTTPRGVQKYHAVSGTAGAGVYVRGRRTPFASFAWTPPPGERGRVIKAIGARVPREVTFFHAGERRFAVVVERSTFTVAERDTKGTWRRRYHEKNFVGFPVYGLRAIVDMDGDGMPEIVQHFSEYDDGRGFEIVLARRPKGDWDAVASNQDTGP